MLTPKEELRRLRRFVTHPDWEEGVHKLILSLPRREASYAICGTFQAQALYPVTDEVLHFDVDQIRAILYLHYRIAPTTAMVGAGRGPQGSHSSKLSGVELNERTASKIQDNKQFIPEIADAMVPTKYSPSSLKQWLYSTQWKPGKGLKKRFELWIIESGKLNVYKRMAEEVWANKEMRHIEFYIKYKNGEYRKRNAGYGLAILKYGTKPVLIGGDL